MTVKVITSAANPVIKRLASLRQKKYRIEESLFLLEGERHIREALKAGWQPVYIVINQKCDLAFHPLPPYCEVLHVPTELLQKISDRDNAEDVIAAFRPVTSPLPRAASDAPFGKKPCWLLLESLRDPGNLGTILRTVHAANAAGVILLGQSCDPWSIETVRASMGSCLHVHIAHLSDQEFLSWRTTFSGQMIATHVHPQSRSYRDIQYALPLIIAMGSEQNGLSEKVIATSDHITHIPMPGGTESLNVGIASALMLFEALK